MCPYALERRIKSQEIILKCLLYNKTVEMIINFLCANSFSLHSPPYRFKKLEAIHICNYCETVMSSGPDGLSRLFKTGVKEKELMWQTKFLKFFVIFRIHLINKSITCIICCKY